MLQFTALLCLALITLSRAGYTLQDDYSGSNFFSQFDFFTADDPTHGFVNYVDQATASASGLISSNNGTVFMGADSTNMASGRGRNSVRITSQKAYNTGLIILDLQHMPGGACGEWPAFWTVGPNWPNSGEIDIIEGVNSQSANAMALHTSSGCSISAGGNGGSAQNAMTGTIVTPNCDVNAAGQAANAGCGIKSSDPSSYGTGFNAAGGGIYATEWTTSTIKIWVFTRANIPTDITSGNPTPANWGAPSAVFGAPCQLGNFIKNQNIVFDITFCGDWAGNSWGADSTCSALGNSCQAYVQSNPAAFKNSYWSINSLRVYGQNGGPAQQPQGGAGYPDWQGQPQNVPQGQGQGQGGAYAPQGQVGGQQQQGQGGWGQQSQPQGTGAQAPDQQVGPPQVQPSGAAGGSGYFNQDQSQSAGQDSQVPNQAQYQDESQPQHNQNANAFPFRVNWPQKRGGLRNYGVPHRGAGTRSTIETLQEDDFTQAQTLKDSSLPLHSLVKKDANARQGDGYAPYVGANGNVYQGLQIKQTQPQIKLPTPAVQQQQQQQPLESTSTVTKTLLTKSSAAPNANGPAAPTSAGAGASAGGERIRRAVGDQGDGDEEVLNEERLRHVGRHIRKMRLR